MKQTIILAIILGVTVLHDTYYIYTTGHVSSMFPVYTMLSIIGMALYEA